MHVRRTLEELGVSPSKRFGQNFLIHEHHAREIASFAALSSAERVLEIGPGLGALTAELLKVCSDYRCVEIEPAFIGYLKNRFPQITDEHVVCEDVRKVAPAAYAPSGDRLVVVSNVPYSVSSDVVLWVFEHRESIKRASFLLQREFAERVAAVPGSRRYGILSVYAAMYGSAELGAVIPGSAFVPEVDVDSRLLRLELFAQPRFDVVDDTMFRKVVRSAFSQRRKTLANSLGRSVLFEKREHAAQLFSQLGIDGARRPETLHAEDFVRIANALCDQHLRSK